MSDLYQRLQALGIESEAVESYDRWAHRNGAPERRTIEEGIRRTDAMASYLVTELETQGEMLRLAVLDAEHWTPEGPEAWLADLRARAEGSK